MRTLDPVTGGASGALTFRVVTDAGAYLLRIETARDYFRNPQRSYACMRAAADVGVAPRVHYTDIDAGVALMDFIDTEPLESFPGGTDGLVSELGRTIARLQTAAAFPPALGDFGALVERMLDVVVDARVLRAGALDVHRQTLHEIRSVYPWDESPQVSVHNDVNPLNVLYDGTQLWLVDWELAFLNDRFADLAIVANNWAETPELEEVLLTSWLGSEPSARDRARLTVMRQLSRLFYATIVLSGFGGTVVEDDTPAPSVDELRQAFEAGTLGPGPELLFTIGKMNARAFFDGRDAPEFVSAMALLRG